MRAFTLVELLVVISIIIVLIALLAPALDQAVYQAELVQCSGKMKAVGHAVTTYASDHSRRYPTSPVEPAWEFFRLQTPKSSQSSQLVDRRPTLRGYLNVNATLLCPLVKQVNLELDRAESFIWSNYNLWFGLAYSPVPLSGPGLGRLGDRLNWNGYGFSVLVNDLDQYNSTYSGAHPTKDGLSFLKVLDNEAVVDQNVTLQNPNGTYVRSEWRFNGTRGVIDANAGYTDLAVQRFPDVKPLDDDRMARVPPRVNGNASAITLGLPW